LLLLGKYPLDPLVILDHTYHEDGDAILVSGTLIEGIGNRFSDIDVYVIKPTSLPAERIAHGKHLRVLTKSRRVLNDGMKDQDEPVFLVHSDSVYEGVKIDVEFRTFDEIDAVLVKLDRVFSYARCHLVLLTFELEEREKMLLHRMRYAVSLFGHATIERKVRRANDLKLTYLLYRWMASDFSYLLDIAGAANSGEWLRAADLARVNLITQMMGFLHAVGVTNFDSKWVLSYLRKCVEAGYVKPSVESQFIHLYTMQGVNWDKDGSASHYIRRTLEFNDSLFHECRFHLCRNPLILKEENARTSVAASLESSPKNLYSVFEHLYRMKAYGGFGPGTSYLLNLLINKGWDHGQD